MPLFLSWPKWSFFRRCKVLQFTSGESQVKVCLKAVQQWLNDNKNNQDLLSEAINCVDTEERVALFYLAATKAAPFNLLIALISWEREHRLTMR